MSTAMKKAHSHRKILLKCWNTNPKPSFLPQPPRYTVWSLHPLFGTSWIHIHTHKHKCIHSLTHTHTKRIYIHVCTHPHTIICLFNNLITYVCIRTWYKPILIKVHGINANYFFCVCVKYIPIRIFGFINTIAWLGLLLVLLSLLLLLFQLALIIIIFYLYYDHYDYWYHYSHILYYTIYYLFIFWLREALLHKYI